MDNNDEDFAFESDEHELDQGGNAGDDLALPQAAGADAEGTYTDNFSSNFTSNFGSSSYEGTNGDDNNNNAAYMSSSGMQAYGDDSPHDTDNNGDAFQGMPEPEALADNALNKFTIEWEGTLKEKAKQEDTKKKQALEAARADHEKFVSERQTRRDTRMSSNRTQEQVFLEQLEADLESDNPWERIVSLVDTQTEPTAPFKDTSRIKSMLIQLKNDPLKSTSSASV